LTDFEFRKNVWNIIKSEAGWKVKNEDMHLLNIDGHITNNCQVISDAFRYIFFFLSVVSTCEIRCSLALSAR
jgi:hypothetical protein